MNDDSLINDVARAKRAYSHRDDDYDDDNDDDYEDRRPRRSFRRRKTSIIHSDEERDEISKSIQSTGGSWFSWIPFFGARKAKVEEMIEENDRKKKQAVMKNNYFFSFFLFFFSLDYIEIQSNKNFINILYLSKRMKNHIVNFNLYTKKKKKKYIKI